MGTMRPRADLKVDATDRYERAEALCARAEGSTLSVIVDEEGTILVIRGDAEPYLHFPQGAFSSHLHDVIRPLPGVDFQSTFESAVSEGIETEVLLDNVSEGHLPVLLRICLASPEEGPGSLWRVDFMPASNQSAVVTPDPANIDDISAVPGNGELTHVLASIANGADSLERAFDEAIKQICKHFGWVDGYGYLRSDDGRFVAFRHPAWWHHDRGDYLEEQRCGQCELCCAAVASHTIQIGKARWGGDLSNHAGCPYCEEARARGATGCVAVPVYSGAHVGAVLEFFFKAAPEDGESVEQTLHTASLVLGRIVERFRAEKTISQQVSREDLIVQLASQLLGLREQGVEETVHELVKYTVRHVQVDSAALFLFADHAESVSRTFCWSADSKRDSVVLRPGLKPQDHPDLVDMLRQTDVLHYSGPSIQEEAPAFLMRLFPGAESVALIPLFWQRKLQGALAFGAYQKYRPWMPNDTSFFVAVGQIVAAALQRIEDQEALRASESRYRAVVNDQIDFICRSSPDGTITFINSACCRFFGATAEDLAKHSFFDLFPVGRDSIASYCDRFSLDKDTFSHEAPFLAASGRERWLQWTTRALYNGAKELREFQAVARDITERVRAEKAVRESGRQLQLLFQSSHDGIVFLDSSGRIRQVNEAACRLFGREAPELAKMCLADLFPERGEDAQKEILGGNHGTQNTFGEIELGLKPAKHVVFEYSGQRFAEGLHVVFFRDITPRKEAERALLESERTLRTLLDTNPESLLLIDAEGKVAAANISVTERLGTEMSEMTGKPIYDFLPAENREERRRYVEKVIKTGKPQHWEDVRLGRNMRNSLHPVYNADGEIVRVAIMALDVTEQREAQHALLESQERLASTIASMDDLVFVVDREGRILEYYRTAGSQSYPFGSEDLVGLKMNEVLPVEAGDALEEAIWRARQSGQVQMAECCVSIDEASTWFNVKVSPRRDDSGEFAGVTMVARDITERKRSEYEVSKLVDLLMGSNRRLSDLNSRLKESNSELEDFAYVASHDLQEPLRKIQAFGDRLWSAFEGKIEERPADYLRRMQDAASRMRVLIEDLLSFSRVTTKANPFKPVNLEACAEEALSDLEAAIAESGAQIEVNSLPAIHADARQMRQLFQNLIGNAIKYRAPGRPCKVHVEGDLIEEVGAKYCVLRVRDNGIGFDEKYVDRIFAVFQRLHGRNEYSGTGVGLAICKKIVSRHGGSISAESTPGTGSVFTVQLPEEPLGAPMGGSEI